MFDRISQSDFYLNVENKIQLIVFNKIRACVLQFLGIFREIVVKIELRNEGYSRD